MVFCRDAPPGLLYPAATISQKLKRKAWNSKCAIFKHGNLASSFWRHNSIGQEAVKSNRQGESGDGEGTQGRTLTRTDFCLWLLTIRWSAALQVSE
jgi:hypothetical protein